MGFSPLYFQVTLKKAIEVKAGKPVFVSTGYPDLQTWSTAFAACNLATPGPLLLPDEAVDLTIVINQAWETAECCKSSKCQ